MLGYSLVHLLVSLLISALLATAVAKFAASHAVAQWQLMQQTHLHTRLVQLQALISTEVRRAGYDGHAGARLLAGQERSTSPFYPGVSIAQHTSEPAASCLLFHYDKNHNGIRDTSSVNEQLGFRLHYRALEARVDGRGCEDKGWHDITDPKQLEVTHLVFSLVTVPPAMPFLQINLVARLKQHRQITATVNFNVELPNG